VVDGTTAHFDDLRRKKRKMRPGGEVSPEKALITVIPDLWLRPTRRGYCWSMKLACCGAAKF